VVKAAIENLLRSFILNWFGHGMNTLTAVPYFTQPSILRGMVNVVVYYASSAIFAASAVLFSQTGLAYSLDHSQAHAHGLWHVTIQPYVAPCLPF